MRRRYLNWMILVFGVIGTIYGAFSLIYNHLHGKDLPILGLLLLIFGLLALILISVLLLITYINNTKRKNEEVPLKEEVVEPVIEETKVEEEKKIETKPEQKEKVEYVPKIERTRVSYSHYDTSTVYVKQVGYGPLLRVEGNRILDMRTNTYYRIENGLVKQEGYGPIFEIRGNQIKNAFGGYLYEISGDNINKVYGGFYASISGNYITLFDLSMKYEMTERLSKNQMLVVVALLFGTY